SLGLCITAGFLYLRYTTPQYAIKSLVLIEQKQQGVSNLLNKLSEGQEASGAGPNLFNEMFLLTSQDLVGMAVDSLDLNIQYWAQGRVKEDELYDQCPVTIVFDSLGYLGTGVQEIRIQEIVEGQFEFRE